MSGGGFLPIIGGIIGTVVAPGIGTALGAALGAGISMVAGLDQPEVPSTPSLPAPTAAPAPTPGQQSAAPLPAPTPQSDAVQKAGQDQLLNLSTAYGRMATIATSGLGVTAQPSLGKQQLLGG